MHYSPSPSTIVADELTLLAYAQQMVKTARTEPAKQMFESFVEQEKRRLSANGAYRFRKIGTQKSAAANRMPSMAS